MTLNDVNVFIKDTIPKVEKALKHLEYSYNKVSKISSSFNIDDLELLEVFESFTSRFSRVSDLFCKKLLRSLIIKGDPSFKGSLTDFLNEAEKLGFLSDARHWWAIRSLRNKEAHEYNEEDLRAYFETIKKEAAFVLIEVRDVLKKL